MAYENYQKVTGTIQNVTGGNDCCSQMVSIMTDTNMETINLIISPETQVIDSVRLRKGMRVAAFYDTSLPALPSAISGRAGRCVKKRTKCNAGLF